MCNISDPYCFGSQNLLFLCFSWQQYSSSCKRIFLILFLYFSSQKSFFSQQRNLAPFYGAKNRDSRICLTFQFCRRVAETTFLFRWQKNPPLFLPSSDLGTQQTEWMGEYWGGWISLFASMSVASLRDIFTLGWIGCAWCIGILSCLTTSTWNKKLNIN